MKRTLMSVAFAVVAALTVAGCGSDTDSNDSTDSSGAQFNDADVTFAQSMIPHHQQAVEMATILLTDPGSNGEDTARLPICRSA